MATVDEAIDILTQLGFPRAQLNERSGLTLLALADLTPAKPWSEASAPLRGVTPMMGFVSEHYDKHYDKHYAPNTRETVRRQSIHQFIAAGLVLRNPDDPERPTNSARTTYQINAVALDLLRFYGSREWSLRLARYRMQAESLAQRWERERQRARIPVVRPSPTAERSPSTWAISRGRPRYGWRIPRPTSSTSTATGFSAHMIDFAAIR